MSVAAASVRELVKRYPKAPVNAVDGISFAVARGEVFGLLGPNGAGKTTLLRAASGALHASTGRVLLEGRDVTGLDMHERARKGLCDIPEGRGIFPSLTVRENLILQSPRGQ